MRGGGEEGGWGEERGKERREGGREGEGREGRGRKRGKEGGGGLWKCLDLRILICLGKWST